MLQKIKDELLSDANKLTEYLEHFGFCNISVKPKYISFARDEGGSSKSIVIYRENNEALLVKDFPKNVVCDIFNYTIKEKGISFRDVIQYTKTLTGIDNYYNDKPSHLPFGGIYRKIKQHTKQEIKTYDESILDKYPLCGNLRFLRDNINLKAQKFFEVRYSVEDQAIVIPIHDPVGELIGLKCRINKEPEENEQKYYYIVPCSMSKTLYGYCDNYEYLESADVVYIAEAEKSVMQAYSYGIRNIVALGSGTISKEQVKLLLSLNCSKFVFLHDVGLSINSIHRNINMVLGYARMREVKCGFWNYFGKDYKDKISPTDLGKEKFKYILENEIKFVTKEEIM